MKKKVSISWSGGKDGCYALYKVLQEKELEVVSLHTSFNSELKRVGMHGTPEALIEAQAAAIGIPLQKIYVPADSSNASYEAAMLDFYRQQKEAGIEAIVFGDIFLEDLKAYRDALVARAGLEAIYPLWQQDTHQLLNNFLEAGFKTAICAVDAKFFKPETAGSTLDQHFIANLPLDVDPCGERGEFHTFVYDGPLFRQPVVFECADLVHKNYSMGTNSDTSLGFWFADLKGK